MTLGYDYFINRKAFYFRSSGNRFALLPSGQYPFDQYDVGLSNHDLILKLEEDLFMSIRDIFLRDRYKSKTIFYSLAKLRFPFQ